MKGLNYQTWLTSSITKTVNESSMILMTSYQCDTSEKMISVDDDGSA